MIFILILWKFLFIPVCWGLLHRSGSSTGPKRCSLLYFCTYKEYLTWGGKKMTSLDDLILIRFFKCYISIWMSGRHIKLNMPHQSSWSSLYTAHLASTTSVNSITIHQMQESFLTPVFPSHMHTIHQQVLLFLISKYLVYIKSISSHFHYQYP